MEEEKRQVNPRPRYLPLRWSLRWPLRRRSPMDNSPQVEEGRCQEGRQNKRITWAEEPWASESTPIAGGWEHLQEWQTAQTICS